MSTFPVSGSTATSTKLPAMTGPLPGDTADTEQVTGPPVRISRADKSLKLMVSSVLAQRNVPWSKEMSSSSISQMMAARAFISRMISSAAWIAASPVSNAVRLPPVTPVQPMVSVSTTVGDTSSALSPRTSAACMATAVREPPMSTEPVIRLMVPSLLTLMVADDACPPCHRYPIATPRPRLGPPSAV